MVFILLNDYTDKRQINRRFVGAMDMDWKDREKSQDQDS